MNSSLPTLQPGEQHFDPFTCFNQAIVNAQLEIQQRIQQAAMENVDVMRPMPLMQLPIPQMAVPQLYPPVKPKEVEVLRARPLPTQNTMVEAVKPYCKGESGALFPSQVLLEQDENDSLMAEVEHLERQSRVTKHKHRKGTTCPRCKVDQALKRLKKRMAKSKGSLSGAIAPSKRDYEERDRALAKSAKANGFLPNEQLAEMTKELAKVEAMTANLDFHGMDSDVLARTVFELERETFQLKHRHFKGITCPKCKVEQKAKAARKVLLSRKSLQRKRKRTEGLLFFDMVHNGNISGLAALADIAELAS